MTRSKSSSAWLKRHVNDPFVRRARAQGYRSRAAFKLLELLKRDGLARPGDTVVDLGAAPGSWSQVLAERVARSGRVFAVDLLEMAAIPGVKIIQGDFSEEALSRRLEDALEGRKIDLVVSDMAPNISGVRASDQARSIHLCELALDFAEAHLNSGGAFVVKAFQGAGYLEFLAAMRGIFVSVASRKPGASRSESNAMYLVGKRLKAGAGT